MDRRERAAQRRQRPRSSLSIWKWRIVVVVAYAGSSWASLRLPPLRDAHAGVTWSAGIAVAALLLGGARSMLVCVGLGALVAHLAAGSSPLIAAETSAGNALVPAGTVALLRWARGTRFDIAETRDDVLFVAAAMAAGIVAVVARVLTIAVTGGATATSMAWWPTWWTVDTAATVIVCPLILAVGQLGHRAPSRGDLVSLAFTLAATVLVAAVAFGTHVPMGYIVIPLIFLAAIRHEHLGASLAVLAAAVVDVVLTLQGRGQFGTLLPATSLMAVQAFNIAIASLALVLASMSATARREHARVVDAALSLETEVARRTADLAATEMRYRTIIEHAQEVIFETSGGRWTFLSPAWESLTGVSVADALGKPALRFVHEEDQPLVRDELNRIASRAPSTGRYVHRYRGAGGDIRWTRVAVVITPGPTLRASGAMWDITNEMEASNAVRRSATEMSQLAVIARQFASAPDVRRVACDAVLSLVDADQALLLEPDAAATLHVSARSSGERESADIPSRRDIEVAASVFASGDPTFAVHDGDSRELGGGTEAVAAGAVFCQPLAGRSGALGVLAVTWTEPPKSISSHDQALIEMVATDAAFAIERLLLMEQLTDAALTDSLTGLANRRSCEVSLDRDVERARRTGEALTVALIDVDHFKQCNDEYGHAAGDRLLTEVAQAWRRAVRAADLVGRCGGDEFLLILANTTQDRVPTLLERARQWLPDGRTCSVGAAQWDGVESIDALLRRVDAALYCAKQSGRNRVCLGEMSADAHQTGIGSVVAEASVDRSGRVRPWLATSGTSTEYEARSDAQTASPHGRRDMPEKKHGPSIKNPKQYEGLRDKGMSKERAAAISNANAANHGESSRKGGRNSH